MWFMNVSARLRVILSIGLMAIFGLCAATVHASTPASSGSDLPVPLTFSQFFKRPVGPYGLEPTATLLRLSGHAVALKGFAVQRSEPDAGPWILSPVPVYLGDEDESLSDDLPASVAHLDGLSKDLQDQFRTCPGPVAITGTLELGPRREVDERMSYVRVRVSSLHCAAASPKF